MSGENIEASLALFQRFLIEHPNVANVISCPDSQLSRLSQVLTELVSKAQRLNPNFVDQHKSQIPLGDGWGFTFANHPEHYVHDLRVYGPNAYKGRIVMIGTAALGEGNYTAIAMASQIGEKLPFFGLKSYESKIARLLNKFGGAATYEINPDGSNGYNLTINKPGQPKVQEMWREVAKRFTHGTALYWVLANVANPIDRSTLQA